MHSVSHPPPGDPVAVAERYRGPIYRYVLRLVSDRSQADDLAQETFLRVQQRLGDLKDPAALEAWLYRIATNLCYDRFRERQRQRPVESRTSGLADEEPEQSLPDEVSLRPDQLLEQNGMSECVLRFLTALPESQRSVLLLHDLQGYTDPEIAGKLGLSPGNVKIRLHRARVRLKAALTEGCDFSRDDRGVFVCEPKSDPS